MSEPTANPRENLPPIEGETRQSERPLGLHRGLHCPSPLGQSFLQPKFLSPLGGETMAGTSDFSSFYPRETESNLWESWQDEEGLAPNSPIKTPENFGLNSASSSPVQKQTATTTHSPTSSPETPQSFRQQQQSFSQPSIPDPNLIQRDRLEGGAIEPETPQKIEQTPFNISRLDSPNPSGEYPPLIRQKEPDSYPYNIQENKLTFQDSRESTFPAKIETFQKQNLENITFSSTSEAIQPVTDSNLVQKQTPEVSSNSDLPRETTSTPQVETVQQQSDDTIPVADISEESLSTPQAETVQADISELVPSSDIAEETESVTEADAVQRQSDDTVPSSDIAEETASTT
ncbi:MAG: hypothetical protein D6680_02780, partial [Cyanobacteria bacterium J007]